MGAAVVEDGSRGKRLLATGHPHDEAGLHAVAAAEEDFGSSTGNRHIDPEDLLYCRPPGGGGYGNPYERDVARVEADILDEYVSPEAARRDYGVVWDSEKGQIDIEKRILGYDAAKAAAE